MNVEDVVIFAERSVPHSQFLDFDAACALVSRAIGGSFRADFLSALAQSRDFRTALERLREAMRSHHFKGGAAQCDLRPLIAGYDARTRLDGFHAFHDWDGKAESVNADSIPVDVLNFLLKERGDDRIDPVSLAILLDYYFFQVLALLSLRVWDGGHPEENLDRLDSLLRDLQSDAGSGHRFVGNAASLMVIATAHYEPEEHGFHDLLGKARGLGPRHQLDVAIVHACALGCHLRFGYEVTYGHDFTLMRADNGADYPWLRFGVETARDAYRRLCEEGASPADRAALAEVLLSGMSADPVWCLHEIDLHDTAASLLEDVEAMRPANGGYSPLSLFYNFSHNVVKGAVVEAVLWADPRAVSLTDLFTGAGPDDPAATQRRALATTLMQYARKHPDSIRGRLSPVIVYDPSAGRRAYAEAIRALKNASLKAPGALHHPVSE